MGMNLTQQRYKGFLKTPFLWDDELLSMKQFLIDDATEITDRKIPNTIRLGNYVEHLVSYQLNQQESIEILKENLQIIKSKQTLGEIDCLFTLHGIPIHLEIAYKFYLYDASVGTSFLDHWIGPNRRDSLVLKLTKTKEKQFPLLYHEVCKTLLKELNFKANEIQQRAYFKAQLFIPYKQEIQFQEINSSSVSGFYLTSEQFKEFINSKFYIPTKLDWLIEPHANVDWLGFVETQKRILEFFEKKSSPLLWLKTPNREIKKAFVVWWK